MTYDILPGCKINYLTVTGYKGKDARGKRIWNCLCVCGNTTELETYLLIGAKKPTKTCGKCEWHIKHKEAYYSWMAMKQRCNDTKHKDYPNYGGRGITYSSKWENFIEFFLTLGDPPVCKFTGERFSLERKNANGNYSEENCVWADRFTQANNRRNTPAKASQYKIHSEVKSSLPGG